MESIYNTRNSSLVKSFESTLPQVNTRKKKTITHQQAELIAQLQQENISLKKILGERNVSDKNTEKILSFEHLCSEILSEIFKYLRAPDLLNSRLVCAKWNFVIVSQQPAQLILNVDHFMGQNFQKRRKNVTQLNVQQLEKQLARRINFDKCLNWESDVEGNLQGLAAIIGANVKEIRFHSEQCVRVPSIFCDFLKNKMFPNLSTISGRFKVSDLQEEINLGILYTLKTINVRIRGPDNSFLQALVDSAPNLEYLSFDWEVIKLPLNSKLKCLVYKTKATLKNYTTKELFNLIKTCSPTLTSLSLLSEQKDYSFIREKLQLPKMPNLLILNLSGQFQQHVGKEVTNIVSTNLPKLEFLFLLDINEGYYTNFLFIDCFQQGFEIPTLPTLKSLKVSVAEVVKNSTQLLFQVRKFFPNLKNLEITNYGDLEDIFDCVKGLDLEELKISLAFPFKLSSLVSLLRENCFMIFKGLKTFVFEYTIDESNSSGMNHAEMSQMTDYHLKQFKTAILSVKEFEGLEVVFHNFTFKASVGHDLMQHILENKLAVRFTSDV